MENIDSLVKELAEYNQKFGSKGFKSYFKYCDDSPQVIKGIFSDQKIRFTQPRALNDPLEFNPTMKFDNDQDKYKEYNLEGMIFPSVASFYWVQAIESQINNYGVLSLTKLPDSFEMWSHYAKGHRGFLIEFKSNFWDYPCMKSNKETPHKVKKVNYVDDYSISIEQFVNKNRAIPLKKILNELFFKKTSRWEHESEYRMVRPLTDCPEYKPPTAQYTYAYRDDGKYLFDFTWDCVVSIVLGANMSSENKLIIAQRCAKNKIPLLQVHIIRDHKDRLDKPSMIYIRSIDNKESKEAILRAKTQLFCTDTIKLGNLNNVVKIKKMRDLPYYTAYEALVWEYYDNLKSQQPQP